MAEEIKNVKVAVIQAAPVMFNRDATVQKTCELIQKAAGQSG